MAMSARCRVSMFMAFMALASAAGTGMSAMSTMRMRATTLLQQGARSRRNDPGAQAVAQTLRTLDADHDGRVAPDEVKAFALAQNLDATAVASEFSGLDTNGDGTLDAIEIQTALGSVEDAAPAAALATADIKEDPPSVAAVDSAVPASTKTVVAEPVGASQIASMPVSVDALTALAPPSSQLSSLPEPVDAAAVIANSRIASLAAGSSQSEVAPVAHLDAVPAAEQAQLKLEKIDAVQQKSSDAAQQQQPSEVELAATSLVQDLAAEAASERDAQDLDRQAAELRANSTALAERAAQAAAQAGEQAALKKAQELLDTFTNLQTAAKAAEEQAAELRARSAAELQQAQDLMSIANDALASRSSPEQSTGAVIAN